MNRSTTQPIPIGSSHPVTGQTHRPNSLKYTKSTPHFKISEISNNDNTNLNHVYGKGEFIYGNEGGGNDGAAQNLSMDLANKLNTTAWDRAPPAIGVDLAHPKNYQFLRHHHTPSSQSDKIFNNNKHLSNNSNTDEPSIHSCVTQDEQKKIAKNRSLVSIDTSPACLQRQHSTQSGIKPQANFLDQSAGISDQSHLKSWTKIPPSSNSVTGRQEVKSQLSLGLDRDKNLDTAENVLPSFNPLNTADNSTKKLTKSPVLQRKSSLSWNVPHRTRIHSPRLPSTPCSSSAVFSEVHNAPLDSFTPDNLDDQSPFIPIKKISRSKSISSLPLKGQSSPTRNNSQSCSVPVITSSSYSSLPYSPAVAFLADLVDATAPVEAPDEEGSQVGNYIMGKVIGHGGFSIVREATTVDLNDGGSTSCVAVKIVKTQTGALDNDRIQRMLEKEISIWSQVSHPNIVPFIAIEKLPSDTFIFCELCTGGNLLQYLTCRNAPSSTSMPLTEAEARNIFNQVAEALRYLHEEKRIVHRDIKLENILQHEDGIWKICDFGLAEYQDEDAAACFGDSLNPSRRVSISSVAGPVCSDNSNDKQEQVAEENDDDEIKGGSLAYLSPEQLRCHKPLRCPSSDIWSLGVVLYALLTGRLPFQDEYEPRLQLQILNGRYDEPTDRSPEALDLLKNMFRLKPEDRWDIGQVRDSPWCTESSIVDCDLFQNNGIGSHESRLNVFASLRSTL
ncbi:hypothetical protein BGZ49_009784 [Haplosporangium sp. Z 27]|nr:hypothetical protein BGZ49_009784 [Haplosporangium sp. Z 27]